MNWKWIAKLIAWTLLGITVAFILLICLMVVMSGDASFLTNAVGRPS